MPAEKKVYSELCARAIKQIVLQLCARASEAITKPYKKDKKP